MTPHEEQLRLEDRMVSAGVERYHKDIAERGLSLATPGKTLRDRGLLPTVAAIEAMCGVRRGKPSLAAKLCRSLDPYVLADLTMRRAIDGAARGELMTPVVKNIGKAVEWHVRDQQLYAANRALWNRKQEQLKTTSNSAFRRKSIDGSVSAMRAWAHETGREDLAARMEEVKGTEWTDAELITVGASLLDCFASATKLVTTEEKRHAAKASKVYVRFTEGTQDWLEQENDYQSLLRPVYLPMLIEPTPWTSLSDGGYVDNSKARVPFIKTKASSLDLDTADVDDAYDAVNLIQSTPFRVNRSVFEVMRQAWTAGTSMGRVPPRFYEDGAKPLPQLTKAQADLSAEERKADPTCRKLMQQRREVHDYNAELRSDVDNFTRLVAVAEEYSDREKFWLPYKLDWRQRCYPIVSFLSPQGDQFNRGLIEFAEGKRMGDSDNSAAWLAIHGANLYGVDKVSFEDRIAWVNDHQLEIISSAVDPFGTPFWQNADGGAKAWPFLAFCFEWAAYCMAGDDHITHLPVALDGSNSGLQHLSAMMRDADGAQATNVMPNETPADIYTEICGMVTASLKEADADDEWARIWLEAGIDRKICKQPTMTYTYSATLNGMVAQIKNALRELDRKAQNDGKRGYLSFTKESQANFEAAAYLGPIVLEAIKGRLPRAAAAMDFLVSCAKVASQVDLPLRWVTPIGVPVVQFYPAQSVVRKEVFIDGRRHRLNVQRADPKKVDKRGTAFGISPNFVHSMDSTHLLWTVLKCADDYGIRDFSMIHDSFGTHATNCDAMALVLRETFVRLYEDDRLEEFRQGLIDRLPAELHDEVPLVPPRGKFDLESVLDSTYFFA